MYLTLKQGREVVNRARARDEPSPTIEDVDDEGDGGWKKYGFRSDLDTDPPGRCDAAIIEVQGLPSLKELKEFMDAAKPIVMRGAAKELNLPRHLLSETNLRLRCGDANVSLAHIPYADQFDSAYNPKVKTVAKLNDYLKDFAKSGVVGDSTVPQYLFSTDFYLHNPSLLENFTQPFEMIRNISGTTVTQGSISTDYVGLELNAQMFVGAPASGAPMHFHQVRCRWQDTLCL